MRSDSYMITHPGVFIEESPEKVCIKLLQETPVAAILTVRVFPEKTLTEDSLTGGDWLFPGSSTKPLVEVETSLEEDERNKCLQLVLPKSEEPSGGLLELEVKSEDGRLDMMAFKEISIYKKEIYPLLQTDKGHYKAKDRVKFRVLLLDENLKPPEDLETIDEIFVEDPRNRRIAQWKKVVRE